MHCSSSVVTLTGESPFLSLEAKQLHGLFHVARPFIMTPSPHQRLWAVVPLGELIWSYLSLRHGHRGIVYTMPCAISCSRKAWSQARGRTILGILNVPHFLAAYLETPDILFSMYLRVIHLRSG